MELAKIQKLALEISDLETKQKHILRMLESEFGDVIICINDGSYRISDMIPGEDVERLITGIRDFFDNFLEEINERLEFIKKEK
jgi:poly(A) polymerase Pap1